MYYFIKDIFLYLFFYYKYFYNLFFNLKKNIFLLKKCKFIFFENSFFVFLLGNYLKKNRWI